MSILRAIARTVAIACGLVLLAACTERPQTASGVKTDTPAWQGTGAPFATPGWKQGDQASWTQQIKNRQQGQNEYARVH